MLALVPLLAPAAVALAGAVACLILLYIVDLWFRSWAYDEGRDDPGLVARVLKWGTGRLRGYVRKLEKRVVNRLGNAVAARSELVVDALNNATELVNRLGTTMSDLPAQTYRALYTLRHVTMPRYVTARLEPIAARLNTVQAIAQGAATTLTAVSVEVAAGLRSLPWGVPAGLPARIETFFNTYKRLWDHVYDTLTPRLNRVLDELLPELRRDLAALAQRVEQRIDARLDSLASRLRALEERLADTIGPLLDDLAGRVLQLERQVADELLPRLAAAELAIATLVAEVYGDVGAGLLVLTERIVALERAVAETLPTRLQELADELLELRAELADGIARGVEAFRLRLEAVEQAIAGELLPRLSAAEEALAALATEVFGPPGAGLQTLVERIAALEQRVEEELLPRLTALEALLAPAALGALALAALRAAVPQLFCRNVTSAASRVCAQDEDLWEALIAGLLVFAIALNPREVAAAGAALTGILGSVIAATVDH